jgi:thiosulfate reductase/polysulfide reductase chain A
MGKLTRRQFLKYGLVGGAMVVSLDPLGRVAEATGRWMTDEGSFLDSDGLTLVPTSCIECPSGCGLLGVLAGDRLIKVMGNPAHPVNKGRICARMIAGLNRIYDPDRILAPLKRTATGKLEPVDWREAYSILASQWKNALGGGNGSEIAISAPQRFFSAPVRDFTSSYNDIKVYFDDEAGESRNLRLAAQAILGIPEIKYDFENSRRILCFGANPYEDPGFSIDELQGLISARIDNGAKVICFDPRLTNTAGKSDAWYPVTPGSYRVLALAMARVILAANKENKEFLDKWVQLSGGELRKELSLYTLEEASRSCGIPADKIKKLALDFTANQPGVAICGLSAGQGKDGFATEAAVLLLNALVGNIDAKGGLVLPRDSELRNTYRPQLKAQQAGGDFLGKVAGGKVPLKLMITYLSNPAFSYPGGFERSKDNPFMVAIDTHLTETAAGADLVLPCVTGMETWGMVTGTTPELKSFMGLVQPVIKPRGKAKSIEDILIEFARNLNKDEPQKNLGDFLKKGKFKAKQYFSVITDKSSISNLQDRGFIELASAKPLLRTYEKNNFSTASGKMEFIRSAENNSSFLFSGKITEQDIESAPNKFRLITYPVNLEPPYAANSKWAQEILHQNFLWMNRQAAAKLGINNGDRVSLKTASGSLKVQVQLIQGIHPGAVAIAINRGHTAVGHFAQGKRAPKNGFGDPDGSLIWWAKKPKGVNINKILQADQDPESGALVLQNTEVTVSKG